MRAAGPIFTAKFAEARITRIELTSTESPTFDGKTFGSVGAYEKLRGKAYGEVDPSDPRNALITDIELAPRNADGKVKYSMDIYLLKRIGSSSCLFARKASGPGAVALPACPPPGADKR